VYLRSMHATTGSPRMTRCSRLTVMGSAAPARRLPMPLRKFKPALARSAQFSLHITDYDARRIDLFECSRMPSTTPRSPEVRALVPPVDFRELAAGATAVAQSLAHTSRLDCANTTSQGTSPNAPEAS
jgi:hypothetical protein